MMDVDVNVYFAMYIETLVYMFSVDGISVLPRFYL